MKTGACVTCVNILLTYYIVTTDSARILAVFPVNVRSHWAMFEPLLETLAIRGHAVDVVSHFPRNKTIPSYRDLSVEGSLPPLVNSATTEEAIGYSGFISTFRFFWFDTVDMCQKVFHHKSMKSLFESNQKYDLIITELFGADCVLGFGHKFQAPVINMITSVPLPWANDRTGNPDNPSYITNYFLRMTDRMTFIERLFNMIFVYCLKIGNYLITDRATDKLARKYFGDDLPPLSNLKRNVSLILVNSHFSMNQVRPLVPAVIEVGGMHIKPPGSLPQDIENFLNDSPHGVIYFSLGSFVRSETFPEKNRQAFLDVFRELPQRVLWRCDGDAIVGLPPNVKTAKWMPQLEILSHPNVRVFITHGGLMGAQEAVYFGVPMVGIPFFADQYQNLHNFKSKGIAVVLDPRTLTKELISEALVTVLHDPSYRERTHRLSRLFRDRPTPPLASAVYWTEYVLRHRGAPHLRSAAVDLSLLQYLLLDVLASVCVALSCLLLLVWCVASRIFARTSRTGRGKHQKCS